MTELLLMILLSGGAVAVGLPYFYLRSRRMRAYLGVWREAAREAGLTDLTEHAGLADPMLAGRASPLQVHFSSYQESRYEAGTYLRIAGLGAGAGALTFRRRELGAQRVGPPVALGDPAFDAEVSVQGPAPLALALLDRPTREHLLGLQQGFSYRVRVELSPGVLEVRLVHRGAAGKSLGRLSLVLQSALAVARRLADPGDLPTLLAANLQTETEGGVRVQILHTLVRDHADRPETRSALLQGLQDGSTAVRLQAAQSLGAEGHSTLQALVADEATEDLVAAQAVAALGPRLSAADLAAALRRAIRAKRRETALACIAALGSRADDVDVAGEEPLIQALQGDDPQVALAAAEALGRLGTAAAVAPLHTAADAVLPSALRSAARQAIAAIQSRLPGAAPGQLALADGGPGALSLASREPGALSLAADSPASEGEAGRRPPEAQYG